jgi:hypothetical protein
MSGRIKTELASNRPQHAIAVAGKRLAVLMYSCKTCGRQDTAYPEDGEVQDASEADRWMRQRGWTGTGTGAYDGWQCPRCNGYEARFVEPTEQIYVLRSGVRMTQPLLSLPPSRCTIRRVTR